MSKPFDAALNSLIDDHRDEWAAFLAARAGVPAGPAEPLDTDLSATRQADRLFRLAGPEPVALHLELESSGRLGCRRSCCTTTSPPAAPPACRSPRCSCCSGRRRTPPT